MSNNEGGRKSMALVKYRSKLFYKDPKYGYSLAIDDNEREIFLCCPSNKGIRDLMLSFGDFKEFAEVVREVEDLMNEEGYFHEQ